MRKFLSGRKAELSIFEPLNCQLTLQNIKYVYYIHNDNKIVGWDENNFINSITNTDFFIIKR